MRANIPKSAGPQNMQAMLKQAQTMQEDMENLQAELVPFNKQINGFRGDTDAARRIELDLRYIDHWSIALDLKILLKTVFGGKMVNSEEIIR